MYRIDFGYLSPSRAVTYAGLMLWMYAGFIALVLILLALDLGVFHRTAHVVSVREALGWSAFWIALGLAFAVLIYFGYERHWLGLGLTPDLMTAAPQRVEEVGLVYNEGSSATVKYLTGYLVEKSLAVTTGRSARSGSCSQISPSPLRSVR